MADAIVFGSLTLGAAIIIAGHSVSKAVMCLAFVLSRMGVRVKDESQ